MIRIYTAPSCASCRKVKAWMKEHHIAYVEKNIFSVLLREKELKELLERSENGMTLFLNVLQSLKRAVLI